MVQLTNPTPTVTRTLDGSAGNLMVEAGSARDTLIGGPGDVLVGGTGANTYVFNAGFGIETVTNFVPSGASADVLQFSKSVFADWAHLLGATKQSGANLVITLDAKDVITLQNVALSSFTAADARFV